MPVALITAADGVYHPTSAASADSADRADVVFTQTETYSHNLNFRNVSHLVSYAYSLVCQSY